MKKSIKRGIGFGLTSGIITTLGLMVGLFSGTNSKLVVLGGILTIAIADAFSDALGIHVSEEFVTKGKYHRVWESTFATFFSKFFIALIFVIPILIFSLKTSILVNVLLGLTLLGIFSYSIAKIRKTKPLKVILEHISIAVLVIIITYFVGRFVSGFS